MAEKPKTNDENPLKSLYTSALESSTEVPKTNFVQRAFLKNAINEVEPDSVQLKGLEHLYSPKAQKLIPLMGDFVPLIGSFFDIGKDLSISNSKSKVNKYLEEGKSPDVKKKIQEINDSNWDIFSKPLSRSNSKKLIDNTIEESELPVDLLGDLELTLKRDAHLSDEQMEQIIMKKLDEFEKDPKLINNLEATRPDTGTYGHSLDTADNFSVLLKKAFPNMSENELLEKINAAQLHDYGKGMTPSSAINSTLSWKENPALGKEKQAYLSTHDQKGFAALVEQNAELPAYYAAVHHSKTAPATLEGNLLKAADIYNAMTGKRFYKKTQTPQKALEMMKGFVERGEITEEAYKILEECVNDGSIRDPKNYKSELDDVYATKAANATKNKGIKLFDIKNAKKTSNVLPELATITGYELLTDPIQSVGSRTFKHASIEAKANALENLFRRNGNVIEANKIKHLFYDDETINKMFAENIDNIKKLYRF